MRCRASTGKAFLARRVFAIDAAQVRACGAALSGFFATARSGLFFGAAAWVVLDASVDEPCGRAATALSCSRRQGFLLASEL